jgi:hypothetical protein
LAFEAAREEGREGGREEGRISLWKKEEVLAREIM